MYLLDILIRFKKKNLSITLHLIWNKPVPWLYQSSRLTVIWRVNNSFFMVIFRICKFQGVMETHLLHTRTHVQYNVKPKEYLLSLLHLAKPVRLFWLLITLQLKYAFKTNTCIVLCDWGGQLQQKSTHLQSVNHFTVYTWIRVIISIWLHLFKPSFHCSLSWSTNRLLQRLGRDVAAMADWWRHFGRLRGDLTSIDQSRVSWTSKGALEFTFCPSLNETLGRPRQSSPQISKRGRATLGFK